ncbi:hypothetical protein COU17_02900 [Candidatus Kaiserbacteria bacterium CG10_big_fil_rev_8_21_14_0_10_49_17]|uniref:EfeO-type cupredoxin-like domain-containing protein n=1 Tax=Candidatus Kaiserbacteria bacterium CG10_big_fil_rev_8_21_14_0_10_49_17 TaxID=1974609 RepID=A0A2M6WE06_9BACT|nr:MAG: hypothetical protein COU17_02900 [Candidatus Kaiserbacteria bacterium CG10_big_fil_rev_8_21_14_0_10_49_17]
MVTVGFAGIAFLQYENTAPIADTKREDASTYRITLTSFGFEPEEIDIAVGDTVVFSSERNTPFWPASNIHPTHEIYPAFDPQKPIDPEEEWAFTFTEPGKWRFHDHITANFTGTITVGSEEKKSLWKRITSLWKEKNCEDVSPENLQYCWDTMLHDSLLHDGLDAAFDLFIKLYRTEAEVPKACHGWGHILGEAAYTLYSNGEQFELRPEAAYCGYGFFHGFIEALLLATNDTYQAYQFCKDVRGSLNGTESVYLNCVHGIGHGITAYIVENPQYWGDFHAIANGGLGACEDILPKNSSEMRNCFDGVFNELTQDLINSEYGFVFHEYVDGGDPLRYCSKYQPLAQTACLYEFMGLHELLWAGGFQEALLYIVEYIDSSEMAIDVVRKLAGDAMQNIIDNEDFSDQIAICRSIREPYSVACINGLVAGFYSHADPERIHERVFQFCQNPNLSRIERKACFSNAFTQLRNIYSGEKFAEVCESAPHEYRGKKRWVSFDGNEWDEAFCPIQ